MCLKYRREPQEPGLLLLHEVFDAKHKDSESWALGERRFYSEAPEAGFLRPIRGKITAGASDNTCFPLQAVGWVLSALREPSFLDL